MSDKSNEENRRPRQAESRRFQRTERNSSPDALSQSSSYTAVSAVLEWDPSADIGPANILPSPPDRRLMTGIPAVVPTYRLPSSSPPDRTITSETSSDVGPTYRDRPKSPPDRTQNSETSSDAGPTYRSPTPPDRNMNIETSADVDSRPASPLDLRINTGTSSDIGSKYRPPRPPPPDRRLNTRTSERSSNEGRRTITRRISETSTDWEYGHSRSQSHGNETSSLSEWQSSGLTKSELKYKARKRPDSTGTGTFSMRIDINPERNTLHILHSRKRDHHRQPTTNGNGRNPPSDQAIRTSSPTSTLSTFVSTNSSRPSTSHHRPRNESNTKFTQYSSQSSNSGHNSSSGDSISTLVNKLNTLIDRLALRQRNRPQTNDTEVSVNARPSKKPSTKTSPSKRPSTKSSPSKKSSAKTSPSKKPAKNISPTKGSVSFFVPFPGSSAKDMEQVNSGTTLQEVYERVNPSAVSNMRKREQILAQMKEERERRGEIKREWLRTHSDLNGLDQVLPPKGPRVMSTQEMKELTRRKYRTLAEVQLKIYQRDLNHQRRVNRVMKQNYAHEVQKNTLSGQRNFEHSRSIIRG